MAEFNQRVPPLPFIIKRLTFAKCLGILLLGFLHLAHSLKDLGTVIQSARVVVIALKVGRLKELPISLKSLL